MKTRQGKACSVDGKCLGARESIVLVARNIRDLRRAYKTVTIGQTLDDSQCWDVEIVGKKQLEKSKT